MAILQNEPPVEEKPCACHAEKSDEEKRARISDWLLAASLIAALFSFLRK
jgi:hypothetical protein